MRCRHIVLAAMLISTPVVAQEMKDYYAQEMKDYYIVADGLTNRCTVVDIKPTPAGTFSVRYDTRELAETALAYCSPASTTGQGPSSKPQ